MPVFIVSCLLLGFLVKTQSLYLPILLNEAVWWSAGVFAVLCFIAGCLGKLSSSTWHDGFASGVIWAWYGGWQPLFDSEAPMFYWFPLYYALLATWVFLALINRASRFDQASREALRYLQDNLARFDTRILAGLLLLSLALTEHYLTYPLTMTLFILRYGLQRSLEICESR